MHGTLKRIILLFIVVALLLWSCQDQPQQSVVQVPTVISVKIVQDQGRVENTGSSEILKEKQAVAPAGSTSLHPEENPVLFEPGERRFYSSTGKIDPFLPLIQAKPVVVKEAVTEDKPMRVLTPLEQFDLSQIRLVAVIEADSGNIAMVEETSGKGYILGLGTYIGKNGGRVEKILNDRIIIKEIVKDFRGDLISSSREMILHKQVIED